MHAPVDSLAVVIPCFNAGARVRPVVEAACAHARTVIVVDDGSTDGCIATLAGLPVRIAALPQNRGKGHALIAGLRAALENPAAEAVCTLDADGQHDPGELPGLYAAHRAQGAALTIGTRTFDAAHVPWRSRFGNKVTVWATARLLGRRLPDTQCGYRVLSRAFAGAAVAQLPGGRYETEMAMIALAIRGGHAIAAAPIATRYEPGNASSHFRKLRDSWRIYRTLVAAALRRG